MVTYCLENLRKSSEDIDEYIESTIKKTTDFIDQLDEYQLDKDVIENLGDYSDDFLIFVFSAEWCPDCSRNVPVLKLISDEIGLEVRVFGNLVLDKKNPDKIWSVPPSPEQVTEFNVKRIPLIIILDKKGNKIGEIVENPPECLSLEETILQKISPIKH